MSFRLRPFDPATDYPGMVAVYNVTFSREPTDVAAMMQRDAKRPPDYYFARWVALADGQVVGVGYFTQAFPLDADRYTLRIMVLPAYERRGMGTALYDQLMAELTPLRPRDLRTAANLARPHSLRFWHARGFGECLREVEAVLDLATYDPTPYAALEPRLAAAGVTLASLADLPDLDRFAPALYTVESALRADVRGCDPITPAPFGEWLRQSLHAPDFLPEAYFVALTNKAPVGLSFLTPAVQPDWLNQRLTGVLPAYRRRGIALALKAHGLAYACGHGCRFIKTDSAVENRAMRELNRRLGFVEYPAWVFFKKTLSP